MGWPSSADLQTGYRKRRYKPRCGPSIMTSGQGDSSFALCFCFAGVGLNRIQDQDLSAPCLPNARRDLKGRNDFADLVVRRQNFDSRAGSTIQKVFNEWGTRPGNSAAAKPANFRKAHAWRVLQRMHRQPYGSKSVRFEIVCFMQLVPVQPPTSALASAANGVLR